MKRSMDSILASASVRAMLLATNSGRVSSRFHAVTR
ncbi:Uncharacterised protein [Mycobacteroides abscessus subsp. abscessus]|nr:Uncharacterised protein [Mycobacteroides abscessus subsp. abscessus]